MLVGFSTFQTDKSPPSEIFNSVTTAPFTESKLSACKKLGATVLFVGDDWYETEKWKNYEKEFNAENCTVVYLDHTDGISSTILRDKINNEKPIG